MAGRAKPNAVVAEGATTAEGATAAEGATTAEGATLAEVADDQSVERLVARARHLQDLCVSRGITVALAESCTGGLIAHVLTEVSGSSAYLQGGIVSYSDEAKVDLLGVDSDVLAAHGAVSAQVARQMASGARNRLRADLAASVTGIAGPDGGSAAKPVGLTYIGMADATGVDVRRHAWTYDRSGNKLASAAAAIELLIERAESVGVREDEPREDVADRSAREAAGTSSPRA